MAKRKYSGFCVGGPLDGHWLVAESTVFVTKYMDIPATPDPLIEEYMWDVLRVDTAALGIWIPAGTSVEKALEKIARRYLISSISLMNAAGDPWS